MIRVESNKSLKRNNNGRSLHRRCRTHRRRTQGWAVERMASGRSRRLPYSTRWWRGTGIDPSVIEDVIMGCVGQAGEQSNNIARNAVLASQLPQSVPATSIDRQCGSSQQALHFAAQAVMAGSMDVVIAAGVESMTRVPMGLPATLAFKHGFGSYMSPAMQARYPQVQFSQFAGAEMLAVKYELTRDELDDYALRSHLRASEATRAGNFSAEILPLARPHG